jgi:hypothetical protein
MMIGSGLQALTTLGKFKPMVLGEIQAAGDTTMMSSADRSAPIHSFMRAADNATKCREAADFDTPAPAGAGTSPSEAAPRGGISASRR